MNTIAIIPARSGSKGVSDKNIKLLDGYPLIAYSIAAAVLAGIERVWVSTDSERYRTIAQEYGAEAPFLRPPELSTDASTDYEFLRHAIDWMVQQEGEVPEYWVHLRPTTPLREPNTLREALAVLEKHPEADSLRSAHPAPESPFKWFLRDKDGYFRGLRPALTSEKVNLPRQQFPTMYIPDGYVDIVRSSYVRHNPDLHGARMLVFESPVCTEIDSSEDFQYSEFQLSKQASQKYQPLQEQILRLYGRL